MRGCATLMGVSEVTSEAQGWRGEGLCDFDGGLPGRPSFVLCLSPSITTTFPRFRGRY